MSLDWIFIAFVVSLTIFEDASTRTCDYDRDDEFHGAHVGLIISPIMSKKTINEIEIYWNHPKYRSGDTIRLYADEPTIGLEPIYELLPERPNGIRKTGIQAEFIPSANLTFRKQCLKYRVAWLRDGVVKKKNCLKTEPNWMAERREFLGSLSMKKLFIPGTHDSAAYTIHPRPASERFIDKYVMTQDIDVLSQLIYGVRYLDIRVGYYPDTNAIWWANHGFVRLMPLKSIIEQVKIFLDNTDEIVIFDVQEFPVGFGKNLTVHTRFVNYLEKEFEKYLLPKRGWSSSLNSIWLSGRRLIISYDDSRVTGYFESVWPAVTQQWGNVRTIDDLYAYLNRIETASISNYRIIPRSAMAELTPNTLDVILNRLGSLRQMAENVNVNVTHWYNTKWQETANVVSVDFVRSSGIVETAIEWNDRRNGIC